MPVMQYKKYYRKIKNRPFKCIDMFDIIFLLMLTDVNTNEIFF